jgi:hypothetical protein
MNKRSFFTAVALTAALGAAAVPALSASATREVLATGKLGNGTVTAWKEGAVLGASIDAAALASLPTQPAIVDLPLSGTAPFQLVEIDWNPQGHEPQGVYTVPHFDVHFYVITKAQRDAIAAAQPGSGVKPDTAMVPEGYMTDAAVVPKMGMHYVPQEAPEFHGKPFTCTPLYGYTNTKQLAFVEAMFTQKFTSEKATCSHPLPNAKGLADAGLPKTISVSPNESNGAYDIRLTD